MTSWINAIFLKITDMFTKADINTIILQNRSSVELSITNNITNINTAITNNVSLLVPYTGATGNVALGNNNISAGNRYSLAGGGYILDNGTALILGYT
jgi:hypothetical protein